MTIQSTGSEEYIRAVSKDSADQSHLPKMTDAQWRECKRNGLYPPTPFEEVMMQLDECIEMIQITNNMLRATKHELEKLK